MSKLVRVFTFRLDQWLSLILIAVLVMVWPTTSVDSVEVPAYAPVAIRQVHPIPIIESLAADPIVTAEHVVLKDLSSSSIIWEKSGADLTHPASLTKLLTALVAIDSYALDESIQIPQGEQPIGTIIGLAAGDFFSVDNLLSALLIASGNDAAYILATHHPHGYAGFVDQMNNTARLLGVTHSTFANPSGLDSDGHLVTAADVAILARAVFTNPVLRQKTSLKQVEISDQNNTHHYLLTHTHQGVQNNQVLAGKTGTTPAAGEALVSLVDINGHQVIIVLLGSKDRYHDNAILIDWLSQSVTWYSQS